MGDQPAVSHPETVGLAFDAEALAFEGEVDQFAFVGGQLLVESPTGVDRLLHFLQIEQPLVLGERMGCHDTDERFDCGMFGHVPLSLTPAPSSGGTVVQASSGTAAAGAARGA
jgi:hypothetical protein